MEKKEYFEIQNKYLAEALAFLGFRYQKFGYGKDTKYSFISSKLIQQEIYALQKRKEELDLVK